MRPPDRDPTRPIRARCGFQPAPPEEEGVLRPPVGVSAGALQFVQCAVVCSSIPCSLSSPLLVSPRCKSCAPLVYRARSRGPPNEPFHTQNLGPSARCDFLSTDVASFIGSELASPTPKPMRSDPRPPPRFAVFDDRRDAKGRASKRMCRCSLYVRGLERIDRRHDTRGRSAMSENCYGKSVLEELRPLHRETARCNSRCIERIRRVPPRRLCAQAHSTPRTSWYDRIGDWCDSNDATAASHRTQREQPVRVRPGKKPPRPSVWRCS